MDHHQGALPLDPAPAPFTVSCPARFSAQPGQRVRVALFSFGARLPAGAARARDQPGPGPGIDGHLSVGRPRSPTVVELPPSSCPVSVNVREAGDSTPRYD